MRRLEDYRQPPTRQRPAARLAGAGVVVLLAAAACGSGIDSAPGAAEPATAAQAAGIPATPAAALDAPASPATSGSGGLPSPPPADSPPQAPDPSPAGVNVPAPSSEAAGAAPPSDHTAGATSGTRPRPDVTGPIPPVRNADGPAPPAAQEAAVLAAYLAFWDSYWAALHYPVNPGHPGLARHSTEPLRSRVATVLAARQRDGVALRTPPGHGTDRVVYVQGWDTDTAEIVDCLVDAGVLYEVATGRVRNDEQVTVVHLALMRRAGGRWQVSEIFEKQVHTGRTDVCTAHKPNTTAPASAAPGEPGEQLQPSPPQP